MFVQTFQWAVVLGLEVITDEDILKTLGIASCDLNQYSMISMKSTLKFQIFIFVEKFVNV